MLPSASSSRTETAQGNRNATSTSNTMNTIATTKNFTDTRLRELSRSGMPLSYVSDLRTCCSLPRPSIHDEPHERDGYVAGKSERENHRNVLGAHDSPLVPKFTCVVSTISRYRQVKPGPFGAPERGTERRAALDCDAVARPHTGGRQ